jgi:hypothetical protein
MHFGIMNMPSSQVPVGKECRGEHHPDLDASGAAAAVSHAQSWPKIGEHIGAIRTNCFIELKSRLPAAIRLK